MDGSRPAQRRSLLSLTLALLAGCGSGDSQRTGVLSEDGAGGTAAGQAGAGGGSSGQGGAGSGQAGSGPAKTGLPTALAGRFYHTCASFQGGQVKCWGDNTYGQLGLGDVVWRGSKPEQMGDALPVVDLGVGVRATGVVTGDTHTCALLDDGRVKCWGDNAWGQLGLGDTRSRGAQQDEMGDALPFVDLGSGARAVRLVAGGACTCALLATGALKCWGQNTDRQLGLGDLNGRGDEPGEMGDALPAVDLGSGASVVAVAAGDTYVCALLGDGRVKCWGHNPSLPLPWDYKKGEMGDKLPVVELGSGSVVSLATGHDHACAQFSDGAVKCWGRNEYGQIGAGDPYKQSYASDALPVVDLGSAGGVVAMTIGDRFSCVVVQGGRVKCWGFNDSGQLGLGDTSNRGDAPGEMGDALPFVDLGTGAQAASVAAGDTHACALLTTGAIRCWGLNGGGSLGLGDTQDRGSHPGQMGDKLPAVDLGSAAQPLAGRLLRSAAGRALHQGALTGERSGRDPSDRGAHRMATRRGGPAEVCARRLIRW